jgi:alcohol dehydrogenase
MMTEYNYEILTPDHIYFGVGSLDALLGDDVKRINAKHACIVTDPGVLKAGLAERVERKLSEANITADIFSGAMPEPTFSHLNETAEELRKNNYDLFIGVGGGSSIDVAKGLAVVITHGGKGEDYCGVNNIPGPVTPIIAIPTTSGTGSEASMASVFHDEEKGQKIGTRSPYINPRMAIVDPVMTYECPPSITAAAGIDALIHAIESYTGTSANNFSDALAVKAIQLISGSLKKAVKTGSDKQARADMAEGSLLSGITFSNSGMHIIHAFAHVLGANFPVPHGVANGLFLPHALEYNISASVAKHANVAEIMGIAAQGLSQEEIAHKGVEAIRILIKDIDLPSRLRDVGVPKEALGDMVNFSMASTRLLSQNPRLVTEEDVRTIWEAAW